MEITTQRVSNGFFHVYADGVKTEWKIINGSLGLSGNGSNMYGVYKNADKPKWLGSLARCKKVVKLELMRAN